VSGNAARTVQNVYFAYSWFSLLNFLLQCIRETRLLESTECGRWHRCFCDCENILFLGKAITDIIRHMFFLSFLFFCILYFFAILSLLIHWLFCLWNSFSFHKNYGLHLLARRHSIDRTIH
jgi:hypothetical protein